MPQTRSAAGDGVLCLLPLLSTASAAGHAERMDIRTLSVGGALTFRGDVGDPDIRMYDDRS